jgi:hypothetical protein
VWEADDYTEHREVFSCEFGPRNGAENVSDVEYFELFFDKEIAPPPFALAQRGGSTRGNASKQYLPEVRPQQILIINIEGTQYRMIKGCSLCD